MVEKWIFKDFAVEALSIYVSNKFVKENIGKITTLSFAVLSISCISLLRNLNVKNALNIFLFCVFFLARWINLLF